MLFHFCVRVPYCCFANACGCDVGPTFQKVAASQALSEAGGGDEGANSSVTGAEVIAVDDDPVGPTKPPAAVERDDAATRNRRKRGFKRRDALPPKARGAPDGPKRTPLHWGDAWQHQESYAVEKVR